MTNQTKINYTRIDNLKEFVDDEIEELVADITFDKDTIKELVENALEETLQGYLTLDTQQEMINKTISANNNLITDFPNVVYSGSYDDLSDKPTIGNAKITIQKNGENVDSFTLNATANKSINISIPTTVSELTDSTNYVTINTTQTISGKKTFTQPIEGTSIKAQWADIAENYKADEKYRKGTLIQFGGEKEITIAKTKVNGVVSSKPAFLLNNEDRGIPVALAGRVDILVDGPVKKFDRLCLSNQEGFARKKKWYEFYKKTIAIALEDSKENVNEVLCVTKFNVD